MIVLSIAYYCFLLYSSCIIFYSLILFFYDNFIRTTTTTTTIKVTTTIRRDESPFLGSNFMKEWGHHSVTHFKPYHLPPCVFDSRQVGIYTIRTRGSRLIPRRSIALRVVYVFSVLSVVVRVWSVVHKIDFSSDDDVLLTKIL